MDPTQFACRSSPRVRVRIRHQAPVDGRGGGQLDCGIAIVHCGDQRIHHAEAASGRQRVDGGSAYADVLVLEKSYQGLDGQRIPQRSQCLGGRHSDRSVFVGQRLDQALGISLGLQLSNVGGTKERHRESLFLASGGLAVAAVENGMAVRRPTANATGCVCGSEASTLRRCISSALAPMLMPYARVRISADRTAQEWDFRVDSPLNRTRPIVTGDV